MAVPEVHFVEDRVERDQMVAAVQTVAVMVQSVLTVAAVLHHMVDAFVPLEAEVHRIEDLSAVEANYNYSQIAAVVVPDLMIASEENLPSIATV